jgi:hypothetical protein
MHNAPVSLCLNSFHQPPHLSRAQTRHFSGLLLADLPIQGLPNQVESLDLMRFHPQQVLSVHPVLLSKKPTG